MANTLGGKTLHNLTEETLQPFIPNLQRRRALDRTLHSDGGDAKRRWKLTCKYLTEAQWNALYQVYVDAAGGSVALNLETVGASVFVVLDYDPAERVQFGPGDGTWEDKGRTFSITAEEV